MVIDLVDGMTMFVGSYDECVKHLETWEGYPFKIVEFKR